MCLLTWRQVLDCVWKSYVIEDVNSRLQYYGSMRIGKRYMCIWEHRSLEDQTSRGFDRYYHALYDLQLRMTQLSSLEFAKHHETRKPEDIYLFPKNTRNHLNSSFGAIWMQDWNENYLKFSETKTRDPILNTHDQNFFILANVHVSALYLKSLWTMLSIF